MGPFGKRLLLDPLPDPEGTVWLDDKIDADPQGSGLPVAVLGIDPEDCEFEVLWMSHTCFR